MNRYRAHAIANVFEDFFLTLKNRRRSLRPGGLSKRPRPTQYRIFCATPGELEAERRAFDELAEIYETEAMAKNILLVVLSIVPYIVNKLPFQLVVDANVAIRKFFALVLDDPWGPPTGNFEPDYTLPCRLKADPAEAMEGIAIFCKAADPAQIEPTVQRLKSSRPSQRDGPSYEFATLDEFKRQLRAQLSDWLRGV